MHLRKILVLATVAAITTAGAASAKTVELIGQFQTEGMAKTMPSGMVVAKLNTATDMLSYSVTYAGLSGPVVAAHFHGPAPRTGNAGVLVPIPGPYMSGMTGEVKVKPAVAKDILAGMTYVNLHTAADPMGEARAQMEVGK